jgi:4-hydroxy-tetrahydrodipicolinate synthase
MVPLVTPVGADGQVRAADVAAMVAALAPYVDGLVPALSTGEGWALGDRQWTDVVGHTVRAAGGLPVLAGALRPTTAGVLERARAAAGLGAAAVAAATPFGPEVTQDQMAEHFAALAAGPLPVVVYHESAVSGNAMAPDTLRRVCDLPGVVAVKDSSGEAGCLARLTGAPVARWQGREEVVGDCGEVDGYLLALAHVEPALCSRLPASAGEIKAACAEHGLFSDDWYVRIKALLHRRGVIADPRPISL